MPSAAAKARRRCVRWTSFGIACMVRIKFQSPALATLSALLVGCAAFAASYYSKDDSELWLSIFFAGFGVFALLAALESLTSYIRLEEAIHICSKFTARCIPKMEIERVTWEKGCGVSSQLTNGSWVQMPELFQNSQGLCNSVRAWLGKGNQ
jgi:hypothetical protein